jgi:hypothetical protein
MKEKEGKAWGDSPGAPKRTCRMRSNGRPRYLGIARCCLGGSIALIAHGTPTGNIQHKSELCALGNQKFLARNTEFSRFAVPAARDEYPALHVLREENRISATSGA